MRRLVFLSALLLVFLAVLLPCIVYADGYSVYEYKGIVIKVPSSVSVSFTEKDAFTVASFTLPEDTYIYVYPEPLQIYLNDLPYNIRGGEEGTHGWLAGWKYRKSHVIHGASGAGVGYQIRIKVHYGSGTDNGENVYLGGKCRPDFGDVRFTDDDGVTLLKYWLQEKVDYDYAVFWVKVLDDLSGGDAMIYVYYGNPSATSISDLAGTFVRVIDGLVLALSFDEGSGNIAYDKSGYGNNGMIYGATWVDGKYGKALSFNGVDNYINVPSTPTLSGLNNMTVMAWVYPTKTTEGTIVSKHDNAYNKEWMLYISPIDYKYRFIVHDQQAGTFREVAGSLAQVGVPVFLAGTYNGLALSIYENAVLKSQVTTNIVVRSLSAPVRVGNRADNARFYGGVIDEVRIYNRALTFSEISDLYVYRPFEVPENAEARGKTIIRKYVSPEPSHGEWGTLESVLFSKVYVRAGVVEIYFGRPVVGEPPTGLFQYLQAGDFLGFIMAAWTLLLRQVFWVLPYFIIFVPLYIKTESPEYCTIIFILLSGFFLLFMPAEAGAVAMVFLSLSLGFLLYKLVVKLIHWH